MDDSPPRDPSVRHTTAAAPAGPPAAQARATSVAPKASAPRATSRAASAKGASARGASPKAASPKARTSGGAAKTAAAKTAGPRAGGRRNPRTAAPGGRAETEAGAGAERGPWRAARTRAVYSRRIQRSNERWSLGARGVAALLRRPELVLTTLGTKDAVERDGRVLNRGVQALVELAARFEGGRRTPDAATQPVDPEVMRAQLRRTTHLAMPVRTDIHAWGRLVPGPEGATPIPVRIYRQYGTGLGLGGDGRLLPGIVYYHGGSWTTGDLDTHDASCRMLAATARCLVVAVDYRLAPEHPFPAAVDDAVAAYAWVQRHATELGIDPRRVGVMGDSAGANLAAVVALESRVGGRVGDDVLAPAAQGLIYPVVDARLDTESITSLSDGFFLTAQAMEQARARYLPDSADWTSWRASPLLAEDHRGLAPALVVTAGFDPLRDDGSNYAEALRSAGVPVEYRCYDDQVHGFMGMGLLADSLALATEVCDAMGRLLRGSVPGSTTGR